MDIPVGPLRITQTERTKNKWGEQKTSQAGSFSSSFCRIWPILEIHSPLLPADPAHLPKASDKVENKESGLRNSYSLPWLEEELVGRSKAGVKGRRWRGMDEIPMSLTLLTPTHSICCPSPLLHIQASDQTSTESTRIGTPRSTSCSNSPPWYL